MRFQLNPFKEPASHLRVAVNPYVKYFQEYSGSDELPILFGKKLISKKGNWLEEPYEQLVVEVGCHFGKTLAEMAKSYPNKSFVGIDITYKRVVKSAQKVKNQNLRNVQSLLLDGRLLHEVFAPAELDGLVVFYPDPWTKRSKAKHRLLDEETLKNWYRLLKPGGFFWIKTDHQPYFEQIVETAQNLGYEPNESQDPFFANNFISTFQGHFAKENLGCFSKIFAKPK